MFATEREREIGLVGRRGQAHAREQDRRGNFRVELRKGRRDRVQVGATWKAIS